MLQIPQLQNRKGLLQEMLAHRGAEGRQQVERAASFLEASIGACDRVQSTAEQRDLFCSVQALNAPVELLRSAYLGASQRQSPLVIGQPMEELLQGRTYPVQMPWFCNAHLQLDSPRPAVVL
ncbi:hypothetical protein BO221_45055 [Archangium sp. Cb G35]|nr:hypothetical protein BO221_45055 [Archangium sp. Cb G35]